jgi:GGDEF domain-containing protein
VAGSARGAGQAGIAAAEAEAAVRQWREAFGAQAEQVAQLQRQAQLDSVSGLPLRRHFLVLLQQRLAEPGGPAVALLLVRVLQLEALNLRLGHEATDQLLGAVADVLQTYVDRVPGTFAGRMNGTDFALCLPVPGVAVETAESLRGALAAAPALRVSAAEVVVGGVDGLHDTSASAALATADAALARAEAGADGVVLPAVRTDAQVEANAQGARAWREQISAALAEGRTQLAEVPVRDSHGQSMHLECPLRVQLKAGGDYQAAERWLALARRSRLMPQVDLAAVELALRAIVHDGRARAVHASPLSLTTPGFISDVAALLRATPGAARSLSIECVDGLRPAASVAPLAAAAAAWRPCGARVGVEHAAASVQQLPALQAAGVQYIKVDARHLQALGTDAAVRGYAQGLVDLVHGLGMTVLATGVAESSDLPALWALGFDGASGPALEAQAAQTQPA